MKTRQEMADAMLAHLATMERRAYDSESGDCAYRSEHGPCLVGSLIADEDVDPSWNTYTSADEAPVLRAVGCEASEAEFLLHCQGAHDDAEGPDGIDLLGAEFRVAVARKLRRVYAAHGVNFTPPKSLRKEMGVAP